MECVEMVPGFVTEVRGVNLRKDSGTELGQAVLNVLDRSPVVVFMLRKSIGPSILRRTCERPAGGRP